MNVVVVTMAGPASPELLGALPDLVRIKSVTASTATVESLETLVISMPHGLFSRFIDRISSQFQRNAVLRMLLRVSPLDRGARFWRALRRDVQVDDFLRDADLLIAGDRDANFTCWQLARRANIVSVSGYAAGKRELMREGTA